jgi:hypothetical protein
MHTTRWLTSVVAGLLIALLLSGCSSGGGGGLRWVATPSGNILQLAYGSDTDFPQYGALHVSSGYLRLIPSRTSGWGTSVILLPSFWTGGTYHQGAPLTVTPVRDGDDLLLIFTAVIDGLSVNGRARISPPENGEIRAVVNITVTGTVTLDNRPGEAFKPVMLSSMHISDTQWDAQAGFVGLQNAPLPANGWILNPPVDGQTFGLTGGTSAWKANAPTVEITLDQPRPITGWVTASADPNDDNLGFWAASDTVLASWSYTIVAR